MRLGFSETYQSKGIIVDDLEEFRPMTNTDILKMFRKSGAVIKVSGEDNFVIHFPNGPNFEINTEEVLLSSIRSMLGAERT